MNSMRSEYPKSPVNALGFCTRVSPLDYHRRIAISSFWDFQVGGWSLNSSSSFRSNFARTSSIYFVDLAVAKETHQALCSNQAY